MPSLQRHTLSKIRRGSVSLRRLDIVYASPPTRPSGTRGPFILIVQPTRFGGVSPRLGGVLGISMNWVTANPQFHDHNQERQKGCTSCAIPMSRLPSSTLANEQAHGQGEPVCVSPLWQLELLNRSECPRPNSLRSNQYARLPSPNKPDPAAPRFPNRTEVNRRNPSPGNEKSLPHSFSRGAPEAHRMAHQKRTTGRTGSAPDGAPSSRWGFRSCRIGGDHPGAFGAKRTRSRTLRVTERTHLNRRNALHRKRNPPKIHAISERTVSPRHRTVILNRCGRSASSQTISRRTRIQPGGRSRPPSIAFARRGRRSGH